MTLPELKFDGLMTQDDEPWGEIDKTLEAYGDMESAYYSHLWSDGELNEDLDFTDLKLPVVTPGGDLHEGALNNAAARLSQTEGIPSDEMSQLEEKIDELQSRFDEGEEEMSVDAVEKYVDNPLLVARLSDDELELLNEMIDGKDYEELSDIISMEEDRRGITREHSAHDEEMFDKLVKFVAKASGSDEEEVTRFLAHHAGRKKKPKDEEDEMSESEGSEDTDASDKTIDSVEELDELLDVLWSS